MKTTDPDNTIHFKLATGGEYHVRVMQVTEKNPDGTPAKYHQVGPSQKGKNLILPAGKNVYYPFMTYVDYGSYNYPYICVGTGSTPNKVLLDGTFEQSGTTVTRASGTGVFVSGNVNDFIKFGTGETAKIITFTNSLTVQVEKSQTVAATTATIYDCSRVTLDTWVKESNTRDSLPAGFGSTEAFDTGISTKFITVNQTAETVAKTYTECGLSIASTASSAQLLSRFVFDTPVVVDVDQFIQIKYTIRLVLMNYRTSTPITVGITGWPHSYAIQSIVSNGTYWDVTVDSTVNDHYVVGRTFTIAGALPATTAISGITSTASDFTVTANGHGKTTGQSIVIAGASPAGYNGTWTVASYGTNTITVTSAANLGAGSGGTVRLATPATWYDGTHTIASFPSATVIRITNANSIVAAGIAGTAKNSLGASAIITGRAFSVANKTSSGSGGALDAGVADARQITYGQNGYPNVTQESALATGLTFGTTKSATAIVTKSGATIASSYNGDTRTYTATWKILSGEAVNKAIRQIWVQAERGEFWITFDERQRKDNGYELTVVMKYSWEPELA